ncbi:MAG: AI-2E family transporter YdiK [Zoogloeaceae bacterium]|nr:AI-2E family transporter YdiK [Zoogloeaceae bacterium]
MNSLPGRPALDLPRITLAVLFILGIIAAAGWILRPFLPALIWATMVVVATWPLMLRVQARAWNRRWLAVTVMTVLLLLVFLVPLGFAIDALVSNADEMAGWAQGLATIELPRPPEWLAQIPVVGERAVAMWQDIADSGPRELARRIAPYAKDVAQWLAIEAGGIGLMAAQFLLTVVISALLYAQGETAADTLLCFARRLAGNHGEEAVELAGQAIRGVALGVVVTALIQSLIAGAGLGVAGVPLAVVLTAIMFVLAVAQIGAAPVLFLAAGWLYWRDDTGWAIALVIWALVVGSMDNFLRPFLIRLGADLPLPLIFAGVIGGLLGFGLVGIFVGPIVLAVTYTLAHAWMHAPDREACRQSTTTPDTGHTRSPEPGPLAPTARNDAASE